MEWWEDRRKGAHGSVRLAMTVLFETGTIVDIAAADASRSAARGCGELRPFLRSPQWHSLRSATRVAGYDSLTDFQPG